MDLFRLTRAEQSGEMAGRQTALTAALGELSVTKRRLSDRQRLHVVGQYGDGLKALQARTDEGNYWGGENAVNNT